MIEWTDRAIVLSARAHGETGVIASLLSAGHGRHAGLVRGGQGRRQAATLQPGALVQAQWRARLEGQLGAFSLEPLAGIAGRILDDRDRLAALAAACALAEATLPDRGPQGEAFDALLALLDALALEPDRLAWAGAYARWEVALLAALGFGLDLSGCALSGAAGPLAYVSPRTGRAATAQAGAPWKDKLLPLPAFLADPARDTATPPPPATSAEVAQALVLTGHFLGHHALPDPAAALPAARDRLVDRFHLSGP